MSTAKRPTADRAGPTTPNRGRPRKPAAKAGQPKPRSRLWKWTKRLTIAAIVLAVVARIALPFALPSILDLVADGFGLTARYESIDLSILSGQVTIRRLQVAARPPSDRADAPLDDPYVDLEYAHVDLELSALLSGVLRVRRAEVDGLDVVLERAPDGGLVLLEHFVAGPTDTADTTDTTPAEETPAEETPAEPAPIGEPPAIDLRLPVRVDALRVQHARFRILDRATSPELDTWVEAHVRITDLGTPDRDARVEITAQGPDLLDRFALIGSVKSRQTALSAKFDLSLDGAHPGPAAPWLADFGITPTAGSLDANAHLIFDLRTNDTAPHTLDADLRIDRVALRADRDEQAAIDAIHIAVRGLEPAHVRVPEITVSGVRGHAERLADGALRVAGFELRPVSPASTPSDAVPVAQGPTVATPPVTLDLDLLQVTDVALAFRDGGVEPAADFELLVDEVAARALVADPARPDATATVVVRARVPGIAEAVTVDASISPFGIRKTVDATVRAERLTLDRLSAHLAQAGLESTLDSGVLTVHVVANARDDADGATRAEATIDGIALVDRDAELAALDQVSISGVVASAAGIAIGEVIVRGTRVPAHRDAEGAMHFVGMKTVRPAPARATAPATPASAPSAAPATPASAPPTTGRAPMPRIELAALRVRETELSFADDTRSPEIRASTSAFEVDIENLALGGPATDAAPDQASVRIRVRSEGVVEELGVRGTISTRPGLLDVRASLQIAGDRLAAGPFAPYLLDLGIEPRLQAGRLRANLDASAQATDAGLTAHARISGLTFQDGEDEPFVSLEELAVDDVVLGPDGVRIGRVTISEPQLRLARDAEGALLAMGMRLAPQPPPAEPTDAPSETGVAPAGPPAVEPATDDRPTDAAGFALDALELRGARIAFRDAALGGDVIDTALVVDADVRDLSSGRGAAAATFSLRAHADDTLEEASVEGTLSLDPADTRAALTVDARGLRAGPLAGYLPPGVTVTLTDGRFHSALDARVAQADAGGTSIEIALTDVSFRDGEGGDPLLSCPAVRVVAPRIDLAGGALTIAELSMSGATLSARRTAEGATELLGLSLTAPPPGADTAPAAPPAPIDPAAAQAAPTQVIDRNAVLPRVEIEKLDLEFARLRFEDLSAGPDTPPLDARARIFAPAPLVLLDADPEALAPIELRLEAAAEPIVGSVVAVLSAAPWQADARLDGSVEVTGLRGARLTEFLPSLANRIDGSELVDGSFTAKLHAEIDLRRRTPTDVDLSRGFGVRAEINDIAFRATPDGEVLAGIEEISVVVPRIAPDGSVHVADVDIAGIRGRVRRSNDGIHALGILVRNPPPAAEPGVADATPDVPPAEPVPATGPAPAAPAVAAGPQPEFRLDQLSIRGLDFVYQDDAADPPMTVPLDGLDIDVSQFTTRAFTEPRPVRFSVSVTGGDVDLPKRHAATSLLTGILGAATNIVTGTGNEIELEKRPMLDELSVAGRLTLYPQPQGRVRTSISALELTAFRGGAKEGGVEIGDGMLDAGVVVDLPGTGGMNVNANFTFDSLQIDEPPGGPVSTYLKLPAPLNTVLFALKDDSDRVQIPLSVHLDDVGPGTGQITVVVLNALRSLITDAIAAAPFRVTGTAMSMIGLGGLFGGDDAPLEDQAVELTFAPGSTGVLPASRDALAPLVELLQDDDEVGLVIGHTFGPLDLERARALATPSPTQTRALVQSLRQRRAELTRRRATLGAETRVVLTSANEDETKAAVRRLQALDRELGQTEDALDRALELLRPGAERRSDRRARNTALEIGNRRLDAVRRALLQMLGPNQSERIEVRRARLAPPEGEAGGKVLAVPKVRRVG